MQKVFFLSWSAANFLEQKEILSLISENFNPPQDSVQLVHKRSVGLGQQYGLLDEMWKRYFTPEHVRLFHMFLSEDRGSKFFNIGKIVFFLLDKATKIF